MKINGEERSIDQLTQWEMVKVHDIPDLKVETARQRSLELFQAISVLSEDVVERPIKPFHTADGEAYYASPCEWATVMGRYAAAKSGISSAGELPSIPHTDRTDFEPFYTVP